MAGSYNHIVDEHGRLRNNGNFCNMIENLGDAYEMAEEMYGMIWWLAGGNAEQVEQARRSWRVSGIEQSPGIQDEDIVEADDEQEE